MLNQYKRKIEELLQISDQLEENGAAWLVPILTDIRERDERFSITLSPKQRKMIDKSVAINLNGIKPSEYKEPEEPVEYDNCKLKNDVCCYVI
jgi:hypothetical protein